MLNFMLGDKILYLFSFNITTKKIEPMHILCLENMDGIILTDTKIEEIQNRYKIHLQDLSEKEMEIEKEFLCYHIQNEKQRINTSIDKLNLYAVIMLAVIPLGLAILDLKKLFDLSLLLLIGVVLIIYSLINICAFIFRTIKVRGIKMSSFNDLRSSAEKHGKILLQYQYDWQQIKYKAQLYVSFVLNLQEWVILALILLIVVSFGFSFEDFNEKILNNEELNRVITINLSEINEPYTDSAVEWARVIYDIEQKRCGQVYFILGEGGDASVVEQLRKYTKLNIEIVRDETIEKNQLKILEEK